MNKIKQLIVSFIIFFIPLSAFSQNGPGIKKILDELGANARSYLLSATRPSYNVSPYSLGKNRINLDINIVFSQGIFELPVSFTYGVTNKIDLFTDLSLVTQTYNFDGKKINGFGDVVAGVRFQFQQSKYFSHSIQSAIKIPTASKSKELGTGFMDFHFAIAQGFNYRKFSFEISTELDFLRRREIPQQNTNTPVYLKNIIDSVKNLYNYKYETEFVVSGGPGFDITDNVSVYTGLFFSRNIKLDYNTLQSYSGLGLLLSKKTSLGIGTTIGIKNSGTWSLSAGISLLF